MPAHLSPLIRRIGREIRLPLVARRERRRDALGPSVIDPGTQRVIDEGIAWLFRAQDWSASRDGGVARDYSLLTGWSTSYPETTGYIVPTLLEYARRQGSEEARQRARRMYDWLIELQLPQGGFQGGTIGDGSNGPVTFNTGQILLGLAAAVAEFGVSDASMRRAAEWLVETQDADGCWRSHVSPYVEPGEKTYDTHVAWGLLEAARVSPGTPYARAALDNVHWALTQQKGNGWPANCCLSDPIRPLTHTIGYFLRGVIEAYRHSADAFYLAAACRTADGLLVALLPDGHLPGRLRPDWSPAVAWVCLTGSAQIAHCWLLLYCFTGDPRYLAAGCKANEYVRRSVAVEGAPERRGAVKGSFPLDGGYGPYCYLNWAAKFCIDSNVLEQEILQERPHAHA